MTPNRLVGGAFAWLLTLQFFIVESIAAARTHSAYSRTTNTISALGVTTSPEHRLMNASFLLQGVFIAAGAILLRPALRGRAARGAPALLGVAAAGVLIVGIFPSDGDKVVHATGAVLYLVGSGIGLIALAYAVRPRSEALGTTLALLGLVGTAMTVFFLAGVTEYLGTGGTERAAAYVLPIGLALAGTALWRMGAEAVPAGADAETDRGLSRREQRAEARARRAERNRERDEALAAAAHRSADHAPDGDHGTDHGADGEPDTDDPWASPGRPSRD